LESSNIDSRRPVAVVTGASSGIGRAAAIALAAQGWDIIGLGRDVQRIGEAKRDIEAAAGPDGHVNMIQADLSSMSDTARAAKEIAELAPRISVLANNAGGAAKAIALTPEGHEETFASNHLGPFLLTQLLLPQLRNAVAGSSPGKIRIINVSSLAHQMSRGFDWEDLQLSRSAEPMAAYGNAKLANIYFTHTLAQRLAGDGIVVHAMHPGAVDTNFIERAGEATQKHMRAMPLMSAEHAAETLVWLANADEPGHSSGGYFHQCAPMEISDVAKDDIAAERLWRESEALVRPFLRA
jgi:NAD(P)-dependent dehydrogenase (short-subunit alcohol dehydrogenase family)